MIDTHAHLYSSDLDISTLVENAKLAGLKHIVNVGIDIQTSLKSLEFSKQFDMIVPTIGIHPGYTEDENRLSELKALAKKHPFKAIGEIGLDYFKMYTDKDTQKRVFIAQLEIASELNLPIIIHNRHAEDDMIAILKDFSKLKKVFHCFGSGIDFIEKIDSDSTFYSFTGNITYSKKGKTINSIRELPLEKIMIETDCPYLTPEAYKGQKNEPAFVAEVAKKIAAVKEISLEMVVKTSTATATSFFNIS
jgi:TatD DNase family protein